MRILVTSLLLCVLQARVSYAVPSVDTFGAGANQFQIVFVEIGDPGNPADTKGDPNPAGKVDYTYRIGKYEVSAGMISKANALGNLGITQFNQSGNKAAGSISWLEAAKFVNWLNEQKGAPPAYKFNGDKFVLWQSGDPGYDPDNPFRNTAAVYFLPSADEWYKAAYYDPASGEYYKYPTGSNNEPKQVLSGTEPGTFVAGKSKQQGTSDIMQAGGLSAYGTMAQGGNVVEWEETEFDLINDSVDGYRGSRGGGYIGNGDLYLLSRKRQKGPPDYEHESLGFRVASKQTGVDSTPITAVEPTGTFSPTADSGSHGVAGDGKVTFEWATIGNPGNPGDSEHRLKLGGVDYYYRISKHEVTNDQYVAFLNAVDPTGSNALQLYNPEMAGNLGGIERSGATDGQRYTAQQGRERNPVSFVSFFDAMRFANWMHNGQGRGDTEQGVYAIGNGLDEVRSPDAQFWIPNENEWYKAAYHDANSGTAEVYFDYATGSDNLPPSDQPEDNPAAANYLGREGHVASGAHTIPEGTIPFTDVGAYTAALSPYGTFDQNGNVNEWTFAEVTPNFQYRGLRGGSWERNNFGLRSRGRDFSPPDRETGSIGFRMAAVANVDVAPPIQPQPIAGTEPPAAGTAASQPDIVAEGKVSFTWATIHSPGNAPDTEVMTDKTTGYGGVDYEFRISKHEVTNLQYAKFLNAVDPSGENRDRGGRDGRLYNDSMSNSALGGISFNASAPEGSKYQVRWGRANNPVAHTSFFDAMRFVNWLHNGQADGDTESGVYTIGTGIDEVRSTDARYWIPSENEWYKAAYYNPKGSIYYNFPTSSDQEPFSDNPASLNTPDNTNVANHRRFDSRPNGYDDGYAVSGSEERDSTFNYLTDVGAYSLAVSPYGTFDQGGNLPEWTEGVIDSSQRCLRGGSYARYSAYLRASSRPGAEPRSSGSIGFRVAGRLPPPVQLAADQQPPAKSGQSLVIVIAGLLALVGLAVLIGNAAVPKRKKRRRVS